MAAVKTFAFPENCISITFFFCEKVKELVLHRSYLIILQWRTHVFQKQHNSSELNKPCKIRMHLLTKEVSLKPSLGMEQHKWKTGYEPLSRWLQGAAPRLQQCPPSTQDCSLISSASAGPHFSLPCTHSIMCTVFLASFHHTFLGFDWDGKEHQAKQPGRAELSRSVNYNLLL